MIEEFYKTPNLKKDVEQIMDEIYKRIEAFHLKGVPQRIIVSEPIKDMFLEYLGKQDEEDYNLYLFSLPVECHYGIGNTIAVEG